MPTKLQTDRIAWLRVLAMLAAGVVTAITTNVISGNDGDGNARTDCQVDFCAADDDELVVTAPGKFEAAAEGIVSLTVPTGGAVTVDTTGVAVASLSSGDDIALSAAHDITLGTTSGNITMLPGANGTFSCSTTGFACNANEAVLNASSGDDVHIYTNVGGGDDINLDAGDDIIATAADDLTLTATAGPLILAGASGQLQLDSTGGIFNAPLKAALIAGGTTYRVPAAVREKTASFTPATTAEETADTFAIPANAWTTNGKTLRIRAWGTTAGNINNKLVRLRLGASGACLSGTSFGSVDFAAATDTSWVADWTIYRVGASAQRAFMEARTGTGIKSIDNSLVGFITESAIIDACITVTNGTSAADLTVTGILWDWR